MTHLLIRHKYDVSDTESLTGKNWCQLVSTSYSAMPLSSETALPLYCMTAKQDSSSKMFSSNICLGQTYKGIKHLQNLQGFAKQCLTSGLWNLPSL